MVESTIPNQPSIDTYKQQAYEATNQAGDLQTSAPGLLSQLKQNLVGIFAKDNPLIQERNTALSNYMSAASQSRADVLPGAMPTVEGRPLTLSPTQQDAITTARMSSAFAPLAGWNEILKGMYGNIGDIVSGAGNIYGNAITGVQNRASSLIDLYKTAVDEARVAQGTGSFGSDPVFQAILSSLLGGGMGPANAQQPSIDDIFSTQETQPQETATQQLARTAPTPSQLGGVGLFGSQLPQVNFAQPSNISGLDQYLRPAVNSGLTLGVPTSPFAGLKLSIPGL